MGTTLGPRLFVVLLLGANLLYQWTTTNVIDFKSGCTIIVFGRGCFVPQFFIGFDG